jgi:hypothetical protein
VLSTIDVFILLDLIGAPGTVFYSLFPQTDAIFDRFVAIEKRLKDRKMYSSFQKLSLSFSFSYTHLFIES